MSPTIWKYPLGIGVTRHSMPEGARVLDVQMQHGAPHLWALVDSDATQEAREFVLYGTGWWLAESVERLTHVGTVQDGEFVWHAFEVLL